MAATRTVPATQPTGRPARKSPLRIATMPEFGAISSPRLVGSAGQQVGTVELGKQAVHHVTAGQPGLPASEAWRYPGHQVIEQAGMNRMIYAGSSGCRVVVVFHKPA